MSCSTGYKTLKDVTLQITFPFAKKNNNDTLFIYQETIKSILNADRSSIYFVADSIYIPKIDMFLCSDKGMQSGGLDYPHFELIYEDKKQSLSEVNIDTFLHKVNYFFTCNLFSNELDKDSLQNQLKSDSPLCKLDELVISLKCDLEYMCFDNEGREVSWKVY